MGSPQHEDLNSLITKKAAMPQISNVHVVEEDTNESVVVIGFNIGQHNLPATIEVEIDGREMDWSDGLQDYMDQNDIDSHDLIENLWARPEVDKLLKAHGHIGTVAKQIKLNISTEGYYEENPPESYRDASRDLWSILPKCCGTRIDNGYEGEGTGYFTFNYTDEFKKWLDENSNPEGVGCQASIEYEDIENIDGVDTLIYSVIVECTLVDDDEEE